ncbi:hypothetical protein BKA70DRAFT_1235305 [Coprinopsis sp. MPI-PUGE-AT-0042]|nr:hypothetical protein BKA70DRAFT_1235305 [Coprinopsis sp. MPI-PUGE-AT-0042]
MRNYANQTSDAEEVFLDSDGLNRGVIDGSGPASSVTEEGGPARGDIDEGGPTGGVIEEEYVYLTSRSDCYANFTASGPARGDIDEGCHANPNVSGLGRGVIDGSCPASGVIGESGPAHNTIDQDCHANPIASGPASGATDEGGPVGSPPGPPHSPTPLDDDLNLNITNFYSARLSEPLTNERSHDLTQANVGALPQYARFGFRDLLAGSGSRHPLKKPMGDIGSIMIGANIPSGGHSTLEGDLQATNPLAKGPPITSPSVNSPPRPNLSVNHPYIRSPLSPTKSLNPLLPMKSLPANLANHPLQSFITSATDYRSVGDDLPDLGDFTLLVQDFVRQAAAILAGLRAIPHTDLEHHTCEFWRCILPFLRHFVSVDLSQDILAFARDEDSTGFHEQAELAMSSLILNVTEEFRTPEPSPETSSAAVQTEAQEDTSDQTQAAANQDASAPPQPPADDDDDISSLGPMSTSKLMLLAESNKTPGAIEYSRASWSTVQQRHREQVLGFAQSDSPRKQRCEKRLPHVVCLCPRGRCKLGLGPLPALVAFQIPQSAWYKHSNVLVKIKGAARRYLYLRGYTKLFKHFVGIRPTRDPEYATLMDTQPQPKRPGCEKAGTIASCPLPPPSTASTLTARLLTCLPRRPLSSSSSSPHLGLATIPANMEGGIIKSHSAGQWPRDLVSLFSVKRVVFLVSWRITACSGNANTTASTPHKGRIAAVDGCSRDYLTSLSPPHHPRWRVGYQLGNSRHRCQVVTGNPKLTYRLWAELIKSCKRSKSTLAGSSRKARLGILPIVGYARRSNRPLFRITKKSFAVPPSPFLPPLDSRESLTGLSPPSPRGQVDAKLEKVYSLASPPAVASQDEAVSAPDALAETLAIPVVLAPDSSQLNFACHVFGGKLGSLFHFIEPLLTPSLLGHFDPADAEGAVGIGLSLLQNLAVGEDTGNGGRSEYIGSGVVASNRASNVHSSHARSTLALSSPGVGGRFSAVTAAPPGYSTTTFGSPRYSATPGTRFTHPCAAPILQQLFSTSRQLAPSLSTHPSTFAITLFPSLS